MPMKSKLPETKNSNIAEWLFPIGLLLLLAAALRLSSWFINPLLNPDGIAYILQAKAFYLQQPEHFFTAYPYPTNLALMIAGTYYFVGDWVISGQIIALFFSLLTIIPLYFLNRLFWSRQTAIMIVFLYVVSPVFVELGHEIIRGPQFWFFLVLGLWGFCRSLERRRPSSYLLIISSVAFVMAAWSRIEGLLPLIMGAAWLLFDSRLRKGRYLAAYFIPLLLILIFTGGVALSSHNSLPIDLLGALSQGFSERMLAALNRFAWLRETLLILESNPPSGVAPYFFDETRDLLWFLALGVTGHSLFETFGYFFFPFTLFGLVKDKTRQQEKISTSGRARLFLALFILGGAVLIYIQILLNWSSSERFVALIYFPTLVFSGYAFNKLFSAWQNRYPNSGSTTYVGLCLIILFFTLPSILKSSRSNNALPFKEIGHTLAEKHPLNQEIKICSTSKKVLFTHFYAYLDNPMVSSPWEHCTVINVNRLKLDSILEANYNYLLLFDRDGGRLKFLEMIERRDDCEVAVLLEKNTNKYGVLTLFSLQTQGKGNPPLSKPKDNK